MGKKGEKKAQKNCLTRQPHLPFPVGSKTAKTKKTYKIKAPKNLLPNEIQIRKGKSKKDIFIYALLGTRKEIWI